MPSSVAGESEPNRNSGDGESGDGVAVDPQLEFDAEVLQLTEAAVKRLLAMGDSPRAALVLYSFLGRGNAEQRAEAGKLLVTAASSAVERLASGAVSSSSLPPSEDHVDSSVLSLGSSVRDSYWDYLIVLEAARVEGDSQSRSLARGEQFDANRVSRWYDTLMDFEDPELNATTRAEHVFERGPIREASGRR